MTVLGNVPDPAPPRAGAVTGYVPAALPGVPGPAAAWQAGVPGTRAEEPFDRVARLAAMVMGTSLASVTVGGERSSFRRICPGSPDMGGWRTPGDLVLCQQVIDSGDKVLIDDTRQDPRTAVSRPAELAGVMAWAGFPVHGTDGYVVGALCVADYLPRHWNTGDAEVLETLAHVASGEVALQAAAQDGIHCAALAQALQESLLPPD
jgi:sigma-B regulation protein RsbU (phosphoserine phosphatase)